MKTKLLSLLALWLLASGPLRAQLQTIKENVAADASPASMNGNIYFIAQDNATGYELWKSNGTPGGNALVKDIKPGAESTFNPNRPFERKVIGSTLYFSTGTQLWKTDGSSAGTVLVKNLGTAALSKLIDVEGTLFFVANQSQVWKSDGTPEGTVLVINLALNLPASRRVEIQDFIPVGNEVFLILDSLACSDQGDYGYVCEYANASALIKSNGTAAGTVALRAIRTRMNNTYSYASQLIVLNNQVYFINYVDGVGYGLWKSNGTTVGTVLVKDFTPSSPFGGPLQTQMRKIGNLLYFTVDDFIHGVEPWRSDGTESGTFMLKDLSAADTYTSDYLEYQGSTYFFTFVYSGQTIPAGGFYKTDGTTAGTVLVSDARGFNPLLAGNYIYFLGLGTNSVWQSDGTASGTTKAFDYSANYDGPELYNAFNSLFALLKLSGYVLGTLMKYTPGSTSTPPALVSTSPARNAVSAARNTNVGLTFSQAMNAATASSTTVKVYGSQTGLRSGSFSGGSTATVTFDPAKDFKPGEKVSVSVTTNAQNTQGDPLAKAVVYDFFAATAMANAQFALASSIPLNNQPGSQPTSLAVADFDGDGDADVAAVNFSTNKVSIRFNNGSGVLSGTGAVNVAGNPRGIVAADLDGDGDTDLAVASEYTNAVTILRNNGAGQFTSAGSVPVGNQPVTITAADFDGDGDLDLATANSASASLSVLFNNGTGQFNVVTSVPVEFTPGSIQAADLDNDGDMDLTNSNYFANTVTIRWNDGKGNFSGNTSFVTGTYAGGVFPIDVDGDGDVDLLASNVASADVKLIRNNGNGSFAAPVAVAIPQGGLQVGDLDGDGDLDVASINPDTQLVTVRLNNGAGVFSGNTSLTVGATPRAIQAADLNGDNELDIVVVDEQSTRVAVLLNGSTGCQATGTILREYWAKLNGNQTSDVPVNKAPTSISYLTSFEGPTGVGENYASRIRGYLCAPETGNYTFWIASDDYGDLYLSSDDNPANKQLIAFIKGFSNPRQYNKHFSQKSALIYLEKGRRYYIEALHKQGWVNDNLSVAWRLPSSPASASPVVIPGSVLSPFVPGNVRLEYAEVANAEAAAGLNLQAAPNPFTHQTTVSFTAQESGQAVLDLYDLQGKKLQRVFDAEVQAGEKQQAQVNGSRLVQGLYLLRLVNGSKVQHLKVLVNQ